jgi:O-methyltransferase involved in polyketide biosynthesis
MSIPVKIAHTALRNRYMYSCYQFAVGGTQYRDKVILENLARHDTRSVLDLGCGPGPTLRVLPEHIDFAGVDLSEDYLKLAKSKRKSSQLILGDVTTTEWHEDLATRRPSLILAMGLFHHLNDRQLRQLVDNLESIMDRSSCLISVDPSIEKDSTPLARWFANNDRGKFVRSGSDLSKFFDSSRFDKQLERKKRMFHIPLDTNELVIKLR